MNLFQRTLRSMLFLGLGISFIFSCAQSPKTAPPLSERKHEKEMSFEDYNPVSTLVVPEHPVSRAKYPFIDIHNHQFRMPSMDLNDLIVEMDKMNMAVMNNLSGRGRGSIEHLKGSLENVEKNAPDRFTVFTNISFAGIDDPNWTKNTVEYLEGDVKMGAAGLKIYKNLGLTAVDSKGKRIRVDDPRLAPVWDKCGELGIPVLIHTGEPASFWDVKDRYNERWLELKQRPNRYRAPEDYPTWEEVMAEQHAIFRKHKNTIFINAHLGWLGNDLNRLGELLDECPNIMVEIGAVLAELGRQPRQAREWFITYQDRVLFGKDSWRPEEYPVYFRVLETADEYFDYYRKRHAFWKMYGLDLPDEVLKKLYFKNALRILPNVDKTPFEPYF